MCYQAGQSLSTVIHVHSLMLATRNVHPLPTSLLYFAVQYSLQRLVTAIPQNEAKYKIFVLFEWALVEHIRISSLANRGIHEIFEILR